MLYKILRSALWAFTHLICRYRVRGLDNIPSQGRLLIVANHLSWYDPILVGVVLPRRAWFFTKVELFRWPILGLGCRLTGQIPVHRGESDRAALEKGLSYLQEGKVLVVFPEGSVAQQGQMKAARMGAAMLAIRSGVPVLPIAHTGTRRVLRSPRFWFPRVDIKIGKPYTLTLPESVSRKAGLQTVLENMMTRIASMLPAENRGLYNQSL